MASNLETLKGRWDHPPESRPLNEQELQVLKALEEHLGPEKYAHVTESMKVRGYLFVPPFCLLSYPCHL